MWYIIICFILTLVTTEAIENLPMLTIERGKTMNSILLSRNELFSLQQDLWKLRDECDLRNAPCLHLEKKKLVIKSNLPDVSKILQDCFHVLFSFRRIIQYI